jgi:hypothetical protein
MICVLDVSMCEQGHHLMAGCGIVWPLMMVFFSDIEFIFLRPTS